MVKVGDKISLDSVFCEIEIIEIETEIPKNKELEFLNWIKKRVLSCETGDNFEYFFYNDCENGHEKEIAIRFYVKRYKNEK